MFDIARTIPVRFNFSHVCFQAASVAMAAALNSDVIEAAKSGDLELVKEHVLADAGCVHTTDGGYDSLLCAHVSKRTCCSAPIFPIFSNPFFCSKRTALHYSSEIGHLDITRFLVESGANLEARDQ